MMTRNRTTTTEIKQLATRTILVTPGVLFALESMILCICILIPRNYACTLARK